jgi:hypothetical protein
VNDLDRVIEDSLRRRAAALPAVPKGYGDVNRRIVRRRRRSASMATAAVTMPALGAIGWAVTRPEPTPTATGFSAEGFDPAFQTTTTSPAMAYRCMGQFSNDGVWSYFEYCEPAYGVDTTLVPPTFPLQTTTSVYDMASIVDRVLFVDGSNGLDFRNDLTARLGVTPRYELPATRSVERTMVMPTGADADVGYTMLSILGVGGFDSWTPDLIGGAVPDGVSVVVVIGTDWFDRGLDHSLADCVAGTMPAGTTIPQTTTTTTTTTFGVGDGDGDGDGVTMTTAFLPPSTTIC